MNGIELFADGGEEDLTDLKLLAVAAHVVDTKASHFDSSTFIDHYESALVEILRAKQARRFLVALANASHRLHALRLRMCSLDVLVLEWVSNIRWLTP